MLIAVLLLLGRGHDARELARFVPDCLVLFRRLLSEPRVPRRHKFLLAATVGYLAMPFDLIPDFIPVIGQIDDAMLAALALAYVAKAAGSGVIEELWPGSERGMRIILALTS